ncbi:H-NS histone family protein [Paraburkholderia sp. Ac-20336]|uniref:H-NS family nucleoid-associated regulatory protein n=1 Tax=unclassified Paraburkholderia TaxID=2615204 RepID=UPI0019806D75|nr:MULTISPECIES: H-NS family nucleoid-associated regulatory protein [unclassified Paraburkholderia]MBN3804534.1 H-NS histone family protein [Paraburkholderia sp. Ac-20336]MBN3850270.1 H-NS histone family protein [Paraburkholderia sp. Ac-20342]
MDERKRDSMIAYLRHRMDEFGIKPEDLAAALASESMAKQAERYRSATGDSWDGNGEMPQWLKQAISAGQSIEHFELSPKPVPTPQPKKQVDWSKDPFAGTPLARQQGR